MKKQNVDNFGSSSRMNIFNTQRYSKSPRPLRNLYSEADDDFEIIDYTEDDEGNPVYAPEAYGFKNYRISGYRYTGFAKDE